MLISGLHGGRRDYQLPRICLCASWLLLVGPVRAAYFPPACLTRGKPCAQLRISLRIHHQFFALYWASLFTTAEAMDKAKNSCDCLGRSIQSLSFCYKIANITVFIYITGFICIHQGWLLTGASRGFKPSLHLMVVDCLALIYVYIQVYAKHLHDYLTQHHYGLGLT